MDVYLTAISLLTTTLSLNSDRSSPFIQERGKREKKENLHFSKKNRKNGDFIDGEIAVDKQADLTVVTLPDLPKDSSHIPLWSIIHTHKATQVYIDGERYV